MRHIVVFVRGFTCYLTLSSLFALATPAGVMDPSVFSVHGNSNVSQQEYPQAAAVNTNVANGDASDIQLAIFGTCHGNAGCPTPACACDCPKCQQGKKKKTNP